MKYKKVEIILRKIKKGEGKFLLKEEKLLFSQCKNSKVYKNSAIARWNWFIGCYPDFVGMQVRVSLVEPKTQVFLFRDSSMVDPDKIGMLTEGFSGKRLKFRDNSMIWFIGCYPDFVGMQVRVSLAEPKIQVFLFRDSSMVDPDKIGMLTEGLLKRN
ncbi:MAG: hypothetical protein WC209_05385 [Ignavibacteriaceae bacterium]|jgi:hypothetical protein